MTLALPERATPMPLGAPVWVRETQPIPCVHSIGDRGAGCLFLRDDTVGEGVYFETVFVVYGPGHIWRRYAVHHGDSAFVMLNPGETGEFTRYARVPAEWASASRLDVLARLEALRHERMNIFAGSLDGLAECANDATRAVRDLARALDG